MSRPLRGKTSSQTVLKARQLRRKLTSSEQILWDALRSDRLQGIKFRRQHPLGPYVLDFFCVKAQLAIELDGAMHDQPVQREYDHDRSAYLESKGIRVIRFQNNEVLGNFDRVLTEIQKATVPTSLLPPSPDEYQEREGRGG